MSGIITLFVSGRNRRFRFADVSRLHLERCSPRRASSAIVRRGQRSAGRSAREMVGADGSGDATVTARGPDAAPRSGGAARASRTEDGGYWVVWTGTAGLVRQSAHQLDRRSGGDEETRTPDPLLAKEMLCRLSYVPIEDPAERWWAFLDSNQRPLPYQGSALTS